ncbi:MAG: threonylcarbamoyl-AMP synthase [Deltaproteobacteria bacterium]|nr:threonylcarbamoyl-AMP synthase [Deltaproteobacteria bacterium]
MRASEPGGADVGDPLVAAARDLRRGALVVAATETLVGLLADPFHAAALARVAVLKQRPPTEAFPLIVPDAAVAATLSGRWPAVAERLAAAFWPGPLTLLVPAAPGLPAELVGPEGWVAVRVPGAAPATRICVHFGGPLVATSANLRGRPPPLRAEDVEPEIEAAVDLIVPGGAPAGRPSTLVACDDAGYRIVRPGLLSDRALRAALR